MSLPSTYQEVEYIQSSGTQYIDTGVSANQYLSYEADFQAINTADYYNFFGARTSSNTNRFGLMIYSQLFHMMVGSTGTFNKSVDNNRHKCSVFLNDGVFTSTWDGVASESGTVGTSVYVNQNFRLFGMNYSSGTSIGNCPMRLYSFKLYIGNSTLVRNFIPCYRKSDNVAGLYDTVNNVFYTNAGSGSFIIGPTPAQSGKIKKFLLGTNLIRPTSVTPSVIEETYTVAAPGTEGGTPFGKPGYKITKLIVEHEAYTTNTGRGVAGIHFRGGSNQIYNIHNQYFLGASYSYGYSSSDGGPYGATRIRQDGNTTTLQGVRANSSATSSQRNAVRMIFTEDSLEYHIGQTYGNWIQEGTITFSAATKTAIQSLFSDQDINASANRWNSINPYTLKQITVTYQSI